MKAVREQNIFSLWFFWQFYEAPRFLLQIWKNYLMFAANLFSLPLLLKTFFAPWRRYNWRYPKAFDVGEFFNTLISKQFAYKVQLLFYMVNKGAKVVEVPFAFAPRSSGESKIIKNEMKETLRVIFLLQLRNLKILKLFKFGAVGFAGYLVNASTLYLFTKLNFPSWAAWGLSTELAIVNNFVFNNIWTFKDQQISGLISLLAKFLQFNLTSSGGLLIQVAVGWITDILLGPGYRQIVLPLTIGFIVMPYNYLMYTFVIWRKKAPSSK